MLVFYPILLEILIHPQHSGKSTYNFTVGSLYPRFCTRGFNQLRIVQHCSIQLLTACNVAAACVL